MQAINGSKVGFEVARQNFGQGLHIGRPNFQENFTAVSPHECHKDLVLEKHALLQNLDVGFGLPECKDPA